MKKKIFSILFALVLVVSFSLIPATSVSAGEGITYFYNGHGRQPGEFVTKYIPQDATNDGEQITIIGCPWDELNGHAYLKWVEGWYYRLYEDAGLTTPKLPDPGRPEYILVEAGQAIMEWGHVEPPVCGNCHLEPGEECDDGNTADGDGCSCDCQLEWEGPEPFGSLVYLWASPADGDCSTTDDGVCLKWYKDGQDAPDYNGTAVTLSGCDWDELNGHWYIKSEANERIKLYADDSFTEPAVAAPGRSGYLSATTTGVLSEGHVDVDEPEPGFGTIMRTWASADEGGGSGDEAYLKWFVAGHDALDYNEQRVTLVDCAWDELNGQWYVEAVGPEHIKLYESYDGTTFSDPAMTDGRTGYIESICTGYFEEGWPPPSEVWVDDDYTGYASCAAGGHHWQYDCFATIQDGIDAVAGSTVNVAAGIYNEAVLIDKQLTLLGAQNGEDPTVDGGRVGDESTINAAGILIEADSVKVDGFTVTGASHGAISTSSDKNTIVNNILSDNGWRGVEIRATSSDNLIANNAISDNGREGIHLWEDEEGGNTIANNIVFENGWIGVFVNGSNNNTIENNIIYDNNTVDERYSGIKLDHSDGNILRGNTISGQYTGVDVSFDSDGNTLTQNTILDNSGHGSGHGICIYGEWGENTGNIITYNTIKGNYRGISVYHTHSGNEAHFNNIVGNTLYGVYNDTAPDVNATHNWWGDGVTTTSAIEPLVSSNVDYSPWLVTSPITGIAPDIVTSGHPWTWYTNDSIQDAIDVASAGDTINVAAGTYNEVVAVHESVNLLGANAGECAGVDPGTRGDESIVNAFHVSVNGVVVDGFQIEGAKVGGSGDATNAIVLDGGTSGHTITNNILPGPGGEPPAGTDRGIVFGGTISETTVSCNEVYGWMSGIYINPTALGSNLLFQYNSIHHNWAGIGSDGLNDVSILDNDFTNNVEGFGSSNVGVNVGVHFNNFCGNTTAIAQYGGEPIDATSNWWGNPNGPGAAAFDTYPAGDAVTDNVNFAPWLGAEAKVEKTASGVVTVDAKTEADTVVIKSGSGTPTITAAKYSSNPGTGFSGDIGKYIDVHIDDPTGVVEIVIKVYYTNPEIAGRVESSLRLLWWNGTSWVACSDSGVDTTYIAGPPAYSGYMWAKVRSDTVPTLTQLSGTAFGGHGGTLPPPPPPTVTLESIAASPSSLTLGVDETQQLTVTATYSDESTDDVTAEASYESSVTSVTTVSDAGLITGVAEGSATITVSYETKTDTVSVTVIVFAPWSYDADGDGVISKAEALNSVVDYFDGLITKAQALEVIALYFAS